MRIALTHEQTDFDGLASLLCAYLVDKQTIPVLPRRLNRNVKAFLTIYGSELPFVDPRDLPNENIDLVYLVDTQSPVSIKGVNQNTTFYVIDHHSIKENLPNNWETRIDLTGANTTLFVETIQDRDILLTPTQSTLLLIGIYEDTGSLTYSCTTARDIRAAAYLLEHGADLGAVSKYINHPLSIAQQQIYYQLHDNAEFHIIQRHNIIISTGNAEKTDEELSTIAHKLLDSLDPDALFLIIQIQGGIQFIARSSCDNIDVAKVASHFGGGGHPRAAAALIKNKSFMEIRDDLLILLSRVVQPAMTVSEIMSKEPFLISPETSVEEAITIMQRYGYEGYPVVENNSIIGLLTRRAIDRAITHKLNLNAKSLMEAGNYYASPDDTIEHLQKIMTHSGWGQIPVCDQDGKVIGIVTRTDLLKVLGSKSPHGEKRNLSKRLVQSLPPLRLKLILMVADTASEQNSALYVVGGFVRDLILGKPSLDLDLVVEGNAITLGKAIQRKYGGRLVCHTRFGTAKWFINEIVDKIVPILHVYQSKVPINDKLLFNNSDKPQSQPEDLPDSLDLISARTEFYTHPTALPTVARGSIKLDLHRRDFTINTLALRLDGKYFGDLYDYWGGLEDIKKGIIKVLHSLSFVDDPTRMLRAVRYEQRYGFRIEQRTLQLITEARSLIRRVSGDRIRHELNSIFLEPNANKILLRLETLGLLRSIHPGLTTNKQLLQFLSNFPTSGIESFWNIDETWKEIPSKVAISYMLWFIPAEPLFIKSILSRLRLNRPLCNAIFKSKDLFDELSNLKSIKPSVFSSKIENLPNIAIYTCYLLTSNENIKSYFMFYMKKWKYVKLNTNGYKLREMGIPPGPIYNKLLSHLRSAWIDGLISTPEEEFIYLQEYLKQL